MDKEETARRLSEHLKLKPGVVEDFEFREVRNGWVATLKGDFKHWYDIPLGVTAYSISEKTGKIRSYGESMRKDSFAMPTAARAEEDLAKE